AELAAVEVEDAAVRLVVEQRDVGDRGVGDGDSGKDASRFDQLRALEHDVDLGFGVLNCLDQVVDVIGNVTNGACGGRSGGPGRDEAGGVLEQVHDPPPGNGRK